MDKGSAQIFGERFSSSMMSNRSSLRGTIDNRTGSNERNNQMRSSMLTPR